MENTKWTKEQLKQTVYIKPKKYVGNKALTTYSITTAILVFLIYIFLLKPSGEAATLAAFAQDLPLGVFLTILICALTAFPSIKPEIKKGIAPAMPLSKEEHPVYAKYPSNIVLASLRFAIVGTILFAFAPIGIVEFNMFGINADAINLGTTWFCIIRAIYAGISTQIMMKRVIYYIICSNQNDYSYLVD